MKHIIKNMVTAAARKAVDAGMLVSGHVPEMEIEAPKHDSQGDLSTNFAMVSAAIQKMAPRKIAETVIAHMEPEDWIDKIEVAGPGFINFFCGRLPGIRWWIRCWLRMTGMALLISVKKSGSRWNLSVPTPPVLYMWDMAGGRGRGCGGQHLAFCRIFGVQGILYQ